LRPFPPGPDRKGDLISEVAHPTRNASEHGSATQVPVGPWIVVVGMHRSGTSVLTGVLGGLGLTLPAPDDQWDPLPSNPEHYESMSMVNFDDRLLESLEGSWDAPPDLSSGWEVRPSVKALDDEARRATATAFPGDGPVAWKDPRACLLLPYWRRLLPSPLAAVLMWRAPMEVARSLADRNGLSSPLGIALWEHYNRVALEELHGTPVYVMSYDQLLRDPIGLCRQLAAWLDSLEGLASRRGTWDVRGGAEVVTETLRHQTDEPDERLLGGQTELIDRLRRLQGAHRSLPAAELSPPSPWGAALIEEHRKTVLAGRRADALEEAYLAAHGANDDLRMANDRLEAANDRLVATGAESSRRADQAGQAVRSLHASTSWKMTRPLRALSARVSHRKDSR
jgi:hypothetical protein